MSIFNLPCPHNDGKECRYCQGVKAQDGWRFKGCFCPPLKGKFIAEVKECPDKAQKREQYINKSALVTEINSLQDATIKNGHFLSSYHEGIFDGLSKIENFLDSLENPFDEELKEFANRESVFFAEREYECGEIDRSALRKGFYWGCQAGAHWQKEHRFT